jgi:hypothetical protein
VLLKQPLLFHGCTPGKGNQGWVGGLKGTEELSQPAPGWVQSCPGAVSEVQGEHRSASPWESQHWRTMGANPVLREKLGSFRAARPLRARCMPFLRLRGGGGTELGRLYSADGAERVGGPLC